MKFEWDPKKEAINFKKRGISFKDAKEVLNCGLVVILKEDLDHEEELYVFLGICKKLNVLVVVVAYPDEDITRIISARKATKKGCFMKRSYDFKKGAVIKGKVKSKKQVDKALSDQQKILTSIRLDRDIVEAAKERAASEGVGYLTWLNKKLRESVLDEKSLEMRIKKLEKIILNKEAV